MIGEDSDGSSTLGSPKVDDFTCDRLCQHKGTTIRHHLPGGVGGARPKIVNIPFFSSRMKMPRVSL